MRTRNDVNADEFSDAARRGSSRICSRLDRGNIAADDCGHQTGADLFVTDQSNVGGFDHRICRLDHRNQTLGLNHSKSFHISVSPLSSSSRSRRVNVTVSSPLAGAYDLVALPTAQLEAWPCR